MANTTDKSILTAAGKALLAQLNAEEKPLIIDKMIFANVPNRPEFPQPDDVVPTDHVVHQEGVEQRGRLSADSVIYSTTLTSDVGPFEFNWTGAYCSEYGVLVTIDHHALTPKSADEPGVAGNTLVRSVVLEYKDIAEITNITVDASSWQYNATPRMKKMDDDVAQAIIDQNGKDWFIDDGFLVTPQASAFNIKAGAGYVSGNRVTLEFDRNVQVPNKPSFIYVDAHREGTPTGEQVTLFDFVVTADEKDDYTDANDVKHFVCKIAQVLADGSVSDLRPEGESASRSWATEKLKNITQTAKSFSEQALDLKEGNAIETIGYHNVGDGCNAPYVIVPRGTHADGVSGAVLNGTFFNLPSGKQAELLNKHGANVAEMGGVGGNSAQAASYNTEAFLRAARTGRPIIVPFHVDGWGYEDAMLELGPGQIIVGPGRNFKGIKANSARPVIKFGKDSYEPAFRGNGLYHLAIENNGGPCLEATWSPNWTVFDCNLRSVGAGINTLQTWQSYRANLISSQVGVSGAESWCLHLMDNTNAFQALGLIASGGSGGGVADIGRSYNVKLDTAVIESSKYGIRVGTNKDQLRGGAVHAFQLLNSNWEQCTEPLRLGDGYSVHGATLMGNHVSNKNKNIISERTASWRIGRVEGMRATGNVFHPADDEFVFDFYMEPYLGSELRYLVEGAIKENSFKSFGAGAYKLSGYFEDVPTMASRLIASCDLELGNEKLGASHEIIFDVDVSQNSTIAISPQSPLGGYVTKIEFLNVPDGVKGTLKLGTLVNTGEIHSIDMATVTPSYGYYDVPFIGNYVRPNNRILASYVHDGASGSFKVKVTYRM